MFVKEKGNSNSCCQNAVAFQRTSLGTKTKFNSNMNPQSDDLRAWRPTTKISISRLDSSFEWNQSSDRIRSERSFEYSLQKLLSGVCFVFWLHVTSVVQNDNNRGDEN
jgi:hypothetical protein